MTQLINKLVDHGSLMLSSKKGNYKSRKQLKREESRYVEFLRNNMHDEGNIV